mmetsp:Transcript_55691/g.155215  ORF Transcript_55691/g.155215 Transcript_55691/m.155215 type:complete len:247 (+) Transcript_55691:460-1200(+)
MKPIAASLEAHAIHVEAIHRPLAQRRQPVDVLVCVAGARPDASLAQVAGLELKHLHARRFSPLLEPRDELAEATVQITPRQIPVDLVKEERVVGVIPRGVAQACELFWNCVAVHPKDALQVVWAIMRGGDGIVRQHYLAHGPHSLFHRASWSIPRQTLERHVLRLLEQLWRHWRMRRHPRRIEFAFQIGLAEHARKWRQALDAAEQEQEDLNDKQWGKHQEEQDDQCCHHAIAQPRTATSHDCVWF